MFACTNCGSPGRFGIITEREEGEERFIRYRKCRVCKHRIGERTTTDKAEKLLNSIRRLKQINSHSAMRQYHKAQQMLNDEIENYGLEGFDEIYT